MCAIGRGIMAAPKLLMIVSVVVSRPASSRNCARSAGEDQQDRRIDPAGRAGVITALELASPGFVLDRGRIAIAGDTRSLRLIRSSRCLSGCYRVAVSSRVPPTASRSFACGGSGVSSSR